MRYTVKRIGDAPISFSAFAEKHQLSLTVHERPSWVDAPRYYALFDGAEIKDGPCLIGKYGDGSDAEEAISEYKREIAGRRLVIGAYTPNRREIQCPNEWEPES